MRRNCIAVLLTGLALSAVLSSPLQGAEPTNAKEAAKRKPTKGYSEEADKARKARMSPAELAWEKVLEENLGGFYLPLYKKAKAEGRATAWDYVKDEPGLPRVLLIGDSISRAYTLTVRKELKGMANVHRAPANCGPTSTGLKKLSVWLGDGKWDLIHFNFGIHDRNTKPKEYAKRLEEIVVRLKKTGAKLLWASSTPLSEGTMKFKRGMMPPKNEIAASIMKKHGIPVNDLYKVALPLIEKFQNKDGCHFKEEGNVELGKAVAAVIGKELKK
jgi:hypothetical protein